MGWPPKVSHHSSHHPLVPRCIAQLLHVFVAFRHVAFLGGCWSKHQKHNWGQWAGNTVEIPWQVNYGYNPAISEYKWLIISGYPPAFTPSNGKRPSLDDHWRPGFPSYVGRPVGHDFRVHLSHHLTWTCIKPCIIMQLPPFQCVDMVIVVSVTAQWIASCTEPDALSSSLLQPCRSNQHQASQADKSLEMFPPWVMLKGKTVAILSIHIANDPIWPIWPISSTFQQGLTGCVLEWPAWRIIPCSNWLETIWNALGPLGCAWSFIHVVPHETGLFPKRNMFRLRRKVVGFAKTTFFEIWCEFCNDSKPTVYELKMFRM